MAIRFGSSAHAGRSMKRHFRRNPQSAYRPIDPTYGAPFDMPLMPPLPVGATTSQVFTGSFTRTSAPSGQVATMPACLSATQVLALTPCFGGPVPKGIDPGALKAACDNARAMKLFALPYCPDAPRGVIPKCLDATWQMLVAYAERYPNAAGPNPGANAMTWAARKDPVWYSQVLATPKCPDAEVTPPPADEPPPKPGTDLTPGGSDVDPYLTHVQPPVTLHRGPSTLAIGGILAAVAVAAGGAYYWSRKKR